MHRNKEGYPDPTAGDAIREADRPPENVQPDPPPAGKKRGPKKALDVGKLVALYKAEGYRADSVRTLAEV